MSTLSLKRRRFGPLVAPSESLPSDNASVPTEPQAVPLPLRLTVNRSVGVRRQLLRQASTSQAYVAPRSTQRSAQLPPTQIVLDDDEPAEKVDDKDRNEVVDDGDDEDDDDDDDATVSLGSANRFDKRSRREQLTPPESSDDDDDALAVDPELGVIRALDVCRDGYQHASQLVVVDASIVLVHGSQSEEDVAAVDGGGGGGGGAALPRGAVEASAASAAFETEQRMSPDDATFFRASQHIADGAATARAIEELIDPDAAAGVHYRCTQSPEQSQAAAAAAAEVADDGLPLKLVVDSFEIPADELDVGDFIEEGHYGQVYRAVWQGGTQVAAKMMQKFAATYQQLWNSQERLARVRAHEGGVDGAAEARELQRRDALALDVGAMLRAFRREAEMLCRLRHPNVVLYLGTCTELPHLMLVTEYLPRGSLHTVLHGAGAPPLDYATKLQMALGAACGVHYLHRCGILHRDLKSGNLLVAHDNVVKVSDFGLARFSSSFVDEHRQRVSLLDVRIQAPEVLRSQKKVYTAKSDVFSFALLLWELAERRVPYAHLDAPTIAQAVANHRLRPPLPSNIKNEYASLVARCWREEPDERPTFADIISVLVQEKELADANR